MPQSFHQIRRKNKMLPSRLLQCLNIIFVEDRVQGDRIPEKGKPTAPEAGLPNAALNETRRNPVFRLVRVCRQHAWKRSDFASFQQYQDKICPGFPLRGSFQIVYAERTRGIVAKHDLQRLPAIASLSVGAGGSKRSIWAVLLKVLNDCRLLCFSASRSDLAAHVSWKAGEPGYRFALLRWKGSSLPCLVSHASSLIPILHDTHVLSVFSRL